MGITPAQFNEMKERVAKSHRQLGLPSRAKAPITLCREPVMLDPMTFQFTAFDAVQFIYRGKPVGKPRMTSSDKWKKRPIVLRYREFADGLRLAAGHLQPSPHGVVIRAFIPMPSSWSGVKKKCMDRAPHRNTPDYDNICKAVGDALFKEDSCLWFGAASKHWCLAGEERLEVTILYAKPK